MTSAPPSGDAAAAPLPHMHEVGHTDAGESVISNGVSGEAALSICVPCYHDSADALAAALTRMDGARNTTLLLFDDGSQDPALTRQLVHHITAWPGPARVITAPANTGRAQARNRLIALAETGWILFIDADMRPDEESFLETYLDALRACDGPALIAGGFSLRHARPTRETALHAAQSARSECLPAAERAKAPGRYVFTSNILVHRDILDAVAFDDGFQGWGWEDVDWGLRVAENYPVRHIDNPATHLGLDTTDTLLAKFGGSGANFARLARRHPDAVREMRLWTMTRRLRHLPLRGLWTSLAKFAARQGWLPIRLRLLSLKLYRALSYGRELA